MNNSVSEVVGSGWKVMLRIITERMGPTLQRATRPKLFSWAFFAVLIMAIPAPKAMIKGTVMGPVVTPPESKATGMKSFGAKKASTMTPI